MKQRWVLDAYCRKGGSSFGYRMAGFRVVGVDKEDHSEGYAGDEFIQGDAIEFIKQYGHLFDMVHAGPPCQNQIAITQGNRARGWIDSHINLIPDTRSALDAAGTPYVIENPPSRHLRPDLNLCGLTYGLRVFRHRYFELGGWSTTKPRLPPHRGHRVRGRRHYVDYDGNMVAVYGHGGGKGGTAEWQQAMGIPWMDNRKDLAEAIPPAYTEWIGHRLAAERGWLPVW